MTAPLIIALCVVVFAIGVLCGAVMGFIAGHNAAVLDFRERECSWEPQGDGTYLTSCGMNATADAEPPAYCCPYCGGDIVTEPQPVTT